MFASAPDGIDARSSSTIRLEQGGVVSSGQLCNSLLHNWRADPLRSLERSVRPFTGPARVRSRDPVVIGRVRRQPRRNRRIHGNRARPAPRQRGTGNARPVGGTRPVFELARADVAAAWVDARVKRRGARPDAAGAFRFDRGRRDLRGREAESRSGGRVGDYLGRIRAGKQDLQGATI